jgi:hypothetical protein
VIEPDDGERFACARKQAADPTSTNLSAAMNGSRISLLRRRHDYLLPKQEDF